jgi:hypothetical protein
LARLKGNGQGEGVQPGIRSLTTQFYTLDQLSERHDDRLVRGDGLGFVLTAAGEIHCRYEDGAIVAAHPHPAEALLATLYPWALGEPQPGQDRPSIGELAVAEIDPAEQGHKVSWKAYDRRLFAATEVGLAEALPAGSPSGPLRYWRQILWLWRFRELGDRLQGRPAGSLARVPHGLEAITDRHLVFFPVVDQSLPDVLPSRWRAQAERLLTSEPRESILFHGPEADLDL